MPFTSPFQIDIPTPHVLSYLFPIDEKPSIDPIWFDADDVSNNLSPKDVLSFIKRMGRWLQVERKVKKGDVVMVISPNHLHFPIGYLGVVASGAAFSGTNPLSTVDEMAHVFKDTQSTTFLIHPSVLDVVLPAITTLGLGLQNLFIFHEDTVKNIETPIGVIPDWRYAAPPSSEAEKWRWAEMDAETAKNTVATINYSSGTTGLPKGVCVSHANLVANVEQTIVIRDAQQPYHPSNRPQERWIGFLPLYHAFGQMYAILMCPKLNVPIYIMKKFDYTKFLQTIQEHKITHLQTAPPILVMFSKRPETKNYDITSIIDILCGAAPLSKELQNEIGMMLPKCNIKQGWGMTEVVCAGMHVPGGARDESGSVGVLDPNCEAKLVDESEVEVPVGERGELWIRGPNVCMGYFRNEKATKESTTPDGWLKTGDVAIVNKDGWFWIVDRKKELIKVKGLQVAPAELEAALLEYNDVADAAVVGCEIDGQELPRGYIQLKEHCIGKTTEDDIHKFMQKRVASYKWLAAGIQFVDEVPKLASGKIVRKLVKEWAKRDALILKERGVTGIPRQSKL